MKAIDPDKERSEKIFSTADFLKTYNKDIPNGFPRASLAFLREFERTYPNLFKKKNEWTLDQHRKKFMDWGPQRTKSLL